MEYIKSFNENQNSEILELKDFCEINLAYLLDHGIELEVVENPGGFKSFILIKVRLYIYKRTLIKINKFTLFFSEWDNLKDYIIPFITRLNNEYLVQKEINFLKKAGNHMVKTNSIIDDTVPNFYEVRCIYIWLKVNNNKILKK